MIFRSSIIVLNVDCGVVSGWFYFVVEVFQSRMCKNYFDLLDDLWCFPGSFNVVFGRVVARPCGHIDEAVIYVGHCLN